MALHESWNFVIPPKKRECKYKRLLTAPYKFLIVLNTEHLAINYPQNVGVFDDLVESEATNKIASQRLEVFVQSGGNLDILLTVHGPLDSAAVFSVSMKSFISVIIITSTDISYYRILLRIL